MSTSSRRHRQYGTVVMFFFYAPIVLSVATNAVSETSPPLFDTQTLALTLTGCLKLCWFDIQELYNATINGRSGVTGAVLVAVALTLSMLLGGDIGLRRYTRVGSLPLTCFVSPRLHHEHRATQPPFYQSSWKKLVSTRGILGDSDASSNSPFRTWLSRCFAVSLAHPCRKTRANSYTSITLGTEGTEGRSTLILPSSRVLSTFLPCGRNALVIAYT